MFRTVQVRDLEFVEVVGRGCCNISVECNDIYNGGEHSPKGIVPALSWPGVELDIWPQPCNFALNHNTRTRALGSVKDLQSKGTIQLN